MKSNYHPEEYAMPFSLARFYRSARFVLVLLTTVTFISGCANGEMELFGTVKQIQHEGQTCWIFEDENHQFYEIITASPQILQPGLRATIRAVEVERKTSCQLPTVIDVLSYRPIVGDEAQPR